MHIDISACGNVPFVFCNENVSGELFRHYLFRLAACLSSYHEKTIKAL